jgi:hypothetical protein
MSLRHTVKSLFLLLLPSALLLLLLLPLLLLSSLDTSVASFLCSLFFIITFWSLLLTIIEDATAVGAAAVACTNLEEPDEVADLLWNSSEGGQTVSREAARRDGACTYEHTDDNDDDNDNDDGDGTLV